MDTYNEIYERMKSKYEAESKSQFDEASDIAIRLKVLAGEIYNAQVNMEWLKNQMFADTATGEYLDYIARQRGLGRKRAVKAQGELQFYITEPTDHNIIIPRGTVVATDESVPKRFCTVEDEELSAGNTLVSIYAEAEQAGVLGNITKNQAVVPVSIPAEIETVNNVMAFTGGEDEETDIELRKRIKDTFTNQPNGTNKAYYEKLAMSVEGVVKAGVVPKVRGTGTVDIYISGSSGDVDDATLQKAQTLIGNEREINVDAKAFKATFVNYNLTVTAVAKTGYSSAEVIAKCTEAFNNFIKGLPIGARLYLSALGKALLETGCIDNYEFDVDMYDQEIPASQCFKAGTVSITVV